MKWDERSGLPSPKRILTAYELAYRALSGNRKFSNTKARYVGASLRGWDRSVRNVAPCQNAPDFGTILAWRFVLQSGQSLRALKIHELSALTETSLSTSSDAIDYETSW